MNTLTFLVVLLSAAAGVFSQNIPLTEPVIKLATKIEMNLIKIKAIECQFDPLIPKQFKQNCADFLKGFDLTYQNCFCHKKEVS